MNEETIVYLNFFLYVVLFVYCYLKYKFRRLCTFISLLYMLSSFASLALYMFPTYEMTYTSHGTVTIEAVIYQYVMYVLLILAFQYCQMDNCRVVTSYNREFVESIQKIVAVTMYVYLLFSLPSSIYKFFSGGDFSEMRNELYGDNSSGTLGIITRVFGSMPFILLTISCSKFFLLNQWAKIDKYCIALYFLTKTNTVLSMVSRATIMFSFLEIIILFLFFRQFMPISLKKKLYRIAAIVLPIFISVFMVISIARFSESANVIEDMTTARYAGESQLNFTNLLYPDLKEPFWGFDQFPLYRRILGLRYDDGLGREGSDVYNTYIQRYYGYPHPTYIFYGILGTYVFNWGFYIPFFLCILLFVFMKRKYGKKSVSFMTIVITPFLGSYIAKGVTYADYCYESGNILIIMLIFMCLYQRINGIRVPIDKRINNVLCKRINKR